MERSSESYFPERKMSTKKYISVFNSFFTFVLFSIVSSNVLIILISKIPINLSFICISTNIFAFRGFYEKQMLEINRLKLKDRRMSDTIPKDL